MNVCEGEGVESVLQADGDADLLIKTTVESSQTKKTVHVGDNTDLIVLLCYYAKS